MGKVNNAVMMKRYLKNNPYLADALKKGVINYSKLARTIMKESNINLNFDALLVACRRYKKETNVKEEVIKKMLKESSIEAKNDVGVVVLKNEELPGILGKAKFLAMIQNNEKTTLILKKEDIEYISEFLKNPIGVKKDLVALVFKGKGEIEKTQGVISYLTSLFGNHGIAIVEIGSCHDEIMIAIHKKNVSRAVEALNSRY